MASTSKRDSIADDWEDVGDDNLSIVSLSGSEEDVPVTELAGLTVREPAFTGASTTETTTVHGSDDASLRYTGKGREIGTESKSGENNSGDDRHNEHLLSQDCSTAQPLFAPSASECLNFEPDEFEQDGNGEPLVSGDVNPDELLGNIDSVREILHDTIHSGNELPTLQLETWGKALTLCRTLAMQVEELRPIVVGYARVWRNSSTDIPLDPGLYSWLSGVRAKALGLQVECRDEMTRTLGRRERTANRVLQDICKDLETFEQQMDEFLPILQVDFNEFQTQDMSIPTAAAGFETLRTMSPARSAPISIPQPTAHISGRNGFVPARPTASISILRTELYRLMDEIEPAVGRLSRLSQHLTHSAGKLAADIAEQYRRVFRAISTMLSNHGSEWIDHGLSGGLTYAEFAQLDADCIRDFAAQLNKVLASMEVEAVHRGPMTLESGLTGTALAGEAIIDGDSALDQLEVLVQVLSATFCVETR